jgi:hypothetical protein
LLAIDGLQDQQVIQSIGGDVAAREHLRPAEEKSLKVGIVPFLGPTEISVRFHFFRHLRQRHQGPPLWAVQEIVEGQKIAGLFQASAGRQNFVINFDGLEHSSTTRSLGSMVAKSRTRKSHVQFMNDRHPGASRSIPNSKRLSAV